MRKQTCANTDQMKLSFNADFNNQEVLDAMLRAIPGITFITNSSGYITHLLSQTEQLPVYLENWTEGISIEEVLPIPFSNALLKLLRNPDPNSAPLLVHRTIQGQHYHFAAKVTPINTSQILLIIHDLSSQKNHEANLTQVNATFEEALAEKESKLNRLIKHAPFILYSFSLEKGRSYHSAQVTDILGYTPEQLAEDPMLWFHAIHPDDQPIVNKLVEQAWLGHLVAHEYRIKTASGEWRWIEDRFINIERTDDDLFIEGIATDVTEKKAAAEQIRQLSLAVEQSPASVVITDLAGRIQYVNRKFTEVTGYTLEEATGKNPRILKSGNKSPEEYQLLWQTICSGKEWHGEFQNVKKNGETYWESASISPVRNPEGRVTHFIAVKEEITEKKRAAEQLRENEWRLQQIASHSRTIVWEIDTNGLYTYISPGAAEIIGYPSEELIGKKHFYDLHPKEGLSDFLEKAMSVIGRQEEFRDLINPVVKKDGTMMWMNTNGMPIRNSDGIWLGYRGSDTDFTERKLAAEQLSKSETRFRSMFQLNTSPMFLADPETGAIVDVNQSCENYYGWNREDFLQKNLTQINVDPEEVNRKLEELRLIRRKRCEMKHRLANGSIRDMEVFASIIEVDGRELLHEIIHDITDRNHYLEAIRAQNQLLREISWTQSHVMRAPLARLMGLVDLLSKYEKDPQYSSDLLPYDRLILEIERSAREFDQIIREIAEKSYTVSSLEKLT